MRIVEQSDHMLLKIYRALADGRFLFREADAACQLLHSPDGEMTKLIFTCLFNDALGML
jgi:hypothetical protein